MRLFSVFLTICIASLTTACHTTKKTSTKEEVTTISLDTINVVAEDKANQGMYRASNTRSNDIIHTKLEVSFDWQLCRMSGKATIEAKPYFYPTRTLYLNAKGMDILRVEVLDKNPRSPDEVTGEAADGSEDISAIKAYTYENDSLKIDLKRVFKANESYSVIIEYVAKPNELKKSGGSAAISDDKGLYFVNANGENKFKMPQIWTQGETQASSVWYPTIDSPNERMTQEVLMRVEDKYTTLSNGILISSVKQGDGTRIDHWKLDEPHAPYLTMMAVGEFKKVTDAPWNGKEISYYVEPLYEEHAKEIFGDTKEMIEFYSKVLGVPYAWPKYAQIVARDYVSGAMENTSATLHGDFMVYQTKREMIDGKKGSAVIAHELFHQWFGDLVTCESWSNLSLNESFATYGEYLWEEHKNGREAADYHHWKSRQGYINGSKEEKLIRFHYKDKEDMFDAISYNKGGQILHMLRKEVGDDAFFASLKKYLETNKYKSVEIHNLRLAFEEVTGRDMNWFFNQWFFNKGRPSLKIELKQKPKLNSDTLILYVEQVQDLKKYPLYTLNLDVDIYVNGKKERRRIKLSEQKQTYIIRIKGDVQLVNVDAERQLLGDIDYPKTKREYFFQYENAPLFYDKLEALIGLQDNLAEEGVYNLFKTAVAKGTPVAIQHYALQQLEKTESSRHNDLKDFLLLTYMSEKNTVTRAKILGTLNKLFPKRGEVQATNLNALQEESYAICAQALIAISKNDSRLALEKASFFERESGKDILFAVASIYADYGGDSQLHFFHDALKYINGFDLMGFSAAYVKNARRCTIPESIIVAAKDLEMLGKDSNKYIKYTTLKGIKDILNTWENNESTAAAKLNKAKKENANTTELEKDLMVAREIKTKLTEIYNRAK